MDLIGKNLLTDLAQNHPEVHGAVKSWCALVEGQVWRTPHDIKATFSKASILKGGKEVIFNLMGNDYRIEAIVSYKHQKVFVEWVGDHDSYAKRAAKKGGGK